MSKIDEAKKILKELGLPAAQQNEISAYTLLALCDIKPRGLEQSHQSKFESFKRYHGIL